MQRRLIGLSRASHVKSPLSLGFEVPEVRFEGASIRDMRGRAPLPGTDAVQASPFDHLSFPRQSQRERRAVSSIATLITPALFGPACAPTFAANSSAAFPLPRRALRTRQSQLPDRR